MAPKIDAEKEIFNKLGNSGSADSEIAGVCFATLDEISA
jgi:hypothetical protein